MNCFRNKKCRRQNSQMLAIAMQQSALELNCAVQDFAKDKNVITQAVFSEQARKYYKQPVPCNLVSYGYNVVASVKQEYHEWVEAYLSQYPAYACFETPGVHVLDEMLKPFGVRSCFMAEYWLPDVSRCRVLPCAYTTKLLTQTDFGDLYLPEWSNALCEGRKELDVLGVGAYDGQKLVGLAACSADCDTMWQIGVDVLPNYRKKGIASALTSRLAFEIMKKGKVPFYCCAWSNVPSARNAIRSGFRPAWVELTVKPQEFIEKMV